MRPLNELAWRGRARQGIVFHTLRSAIALGKAFGVENPRASEVRGQLRDSIGYSIGLVGDGHGAQHSPVEGAHSPGSPQRDQRHPSVVLVGLEYRLGSGTPEVPEGDITAQ